LKYFHGSGRSVDKKISEIESEMKLQETGQIDAQHIDEFRKSFIHFIYILIIFYFIFHHSFFAL